MVVVSIIDDGFIAGAGVGGDGICGLVIRCGPCEHADKLKDKQN